jgi:hypothetical protein
MIRAALALAAATLVAAPADAAGPFGVDDATIVAPRACQLEAFTLQSRDDYAYVVQPACNPTGNLQIQLGGSRLRSDGEHIDTGGVQFKTVLREADGALWGIGVSAGAVRGRNRTSGGEATDGYVNVPVTVPLGDALNLNLNAGVLRDGATAQLAGTWGAALEWKAGAGVRVVAETFRLLQARPNFQAGAFVTLVPERVELVALYGSVRGGGDGWVSVGVQLYSPPFLH